MNSQVENILEVCWCIFDNSLVEYEHQAYTDGAMRKKARIMKRKIHNQYKGKMYRSVQEQLAVGYISA